MNWQSRRKAARLSAGVLLGVMTGLTGAKALLPLPAKPPKGGAASARASALAIVDKFEKAYKNKDKNTMLMKLMVPSKDNGALEKRYQWLRGYGPHDLPGSVHPPILFQTSKGSFVPSSYKVQSAKPSENNTWEVVVREQGTYRDEDGRYAVVRIRHFKVMSYQGKWYVLDYFLAENPEDYGFYVDDISDKMTHLGK